MNKVFYSVLFVSCFFSLAASAMESGINQGGLGFLFPDANSFSNPGAFSGEYGTSIQGAYSRSSATGGDQEFTPSAVYGNGKFGIGAYGSRTATNLTEPTDAADQIGAAMGVGIIHDKLDFGLGYSRYISANPANNGVATASLTLHGAKDMGPSLGVAFNDTFNTNGTSTNGGTVAIGYGFKHNTSIEADATFLDLSNYKDVVLGAFVNVGSQMVYLSAGYEYWNEFTFKNEILGRLGFILGKNVDFSVTAGDFLETGATLNYGATLRFSF